MNWLSGSEEVQLLDETESNDSAPRQADIKKALSKIEVKCCAIFRLLKRASSMEQVNVIESECSEAWSTVTDIHAELLEFPSPGVTLKLQAERLEDKLTDMRAEARRSKEAFSSSSKVIKNDEKTDMIPSTKSKTEPKFVDPWRESESQCGRGRSEKFSGSSMGTRPERDYYDHEPRTSPSNPFLPRYNVPPPSPMMPIDPWSGGRF